MLARGPAKLSAAVLYESEVIRINKSGKRRERLQAVYPSDGTYWSDHPVGIVRADWVTSEHAEAAQQYIDFLMADAQQKRGLAHGFRPGRGTPKTDVDLGDPFTAKYGVDPSRPRKVLTAPGSAVVEGVIQLWRTEQQGVRVVLAIDVSFSMNSFRKLQRAREAAIELVEGLSDSARLTLLTFNHDVHVVARDVLLDAKGKKEIVGHLNDLKARGQTALYDAVCASSEALSDPVKGAGPREKKNAMRAVILLSDGLDTSSKMPVAAMHRRLVVGGDGPAFYTIAYGRPGPEKEDPDPPDRPLLAKIAADTGGRAYDARPDSIDRVLDDVSSFFGARPRAAKK
jgi:Ca-activated chloride channel family protein